MRPNGLVLRASMLSTALAAAKQCYYVDGSDVPDSSFQPCFPTKDNSPCCASNKGSGDMCLSSGICYAQQGIYNGMFYVNGCTDKTGKSNDCVQVCPNGDGKVRVWNILPCNTGKFCCRDSRSDKNCCDDDNAIINLDIGTLNLPTRTLTLSGATSATAASATGTIATTSSPQPTSTAACDKSAGSSGDKQCPADNTAVVGGAVGGILGAALIASVIAIIFLLRRRPSASAAAAQQQQQQEPPKVTYELHSAPAYGQ